MQRINQEITAPVVRLIGSDGNVVGVVKLNEALRLAEEEDTDLVEIAPNADPPVVRVMDFGKFKYQEAKRQHEAKLKQKVIQVKEVKFRPGTDDGDYGVKLRNLIRFLEDGDKTKITLPFTVPTAEKMNASIDKLMAGPTAGDYYAAAEFYYKENKIYTAVKKHH